MVVHVGTLITLLATQIMEHVNQTVEETLERHALPAIHHSVVLNVTIQVLTIA